jgi:hypothetical protein
MFFMKNNYWQIFCLCLFFTNKRYAVLLMICKKKGLVALATLCVSFYVQSGPITQRTGFDNFLGTCPGALAPNYVADWGEVIAAFSGTDVGNITADQACRFNRSTQAKFYDLDGTPKPEYAEFGLPSGVPFEIEDLGTLVVDRLVGTTETVAGTIESGVYGSMILYEENLGLPEIKVFATAAENERITVNGYAATEYLWTGQQEELSFVVDFDFFGSSDLFNIEGTSGVFNSGFSITAGVSTDLFNEELGYGIDDVRGGNVIVEDSFFTGNLAQRPSMTELLPYEGSLNLNFTVNNGDKFFLWGFAQAFAVNGGFLNAANTVTTNIRLANDTSVGNGDTSAALSQFLDLAPPTALNAPTTIILLVLGLFAVVYRNQVSKRSQRG